jgi:hypothetical protein
MSGLIVVLLAARTAGAVCTNDIQCEGDLVCEQGACVPPATAAVPTRIVAIPPAPRPAAPPLVSAPVRPLEISSCSDAERCGRACDRREVTACTNLGAFYESGSGGVLRDALQAALLYRRGCDGGDGRACTRLGAAFRTGTGVTQDPVQAAVLTRHGCELGDAEGCAVYAWYLDNGEGVRRDPAEATTFYRRACSNGATDACSAAAGVRQGPFRAVGLEWTDPAGPMDWASAQAYCAGTSVAGGHWRLPTRAELATLYQVKRSTPAVTFDRDAYWSATRSDDRSASFVNLTGFDGRFDTSGTLGVRCVR